MASIYVVNIVLLWIVVLVNLLLTLALVRRNNSPANDAEIAVETLPIDSQAPAFIAESLHGERTTVVDYAHRKFILVFISPTCGHCRPHIPVLEVLQPKAKKYGIELVLVSDSEMEATQAYVRELNTSLPVLVAPRETNTFLTDYKIGGVPMYTIVDENSKIKGGGLLGDSLWKSTTEGW